MISKVVILGAGIMSIEIAVEAAAYGYTVTLWHHRDALGASRRLDTKISKLCKNGLIDGETVRSRITVSDNLEVCSTAELIIESIVEDYSKKAELFMRLSEYLGKGQILCTNTSSLSIKSLSRNIKNKEAFAGLHFFNPVRKTKLVEIVSSDKTSSQTVEVLKNFISSMEKEYIHIEDSPGFIVNRLLFSYLNSAASLLEEGIAAAHDIDKSMKLGANYPIGPFALCDLIGIDVVHSILDSLYLQLGNPAFKPSPVFEEMLKHGKLGRKSGEGFFNY